MRFPPGLSRKRLGARGYTHCDGRTPRLVPARRRARLRRPGGRRLGRGGPEAGLGAARARGGGAGRRALAGRPSVVVADRASRQRRCLPSSGSGGSRPRRSRPPRSAHWCWRRSRSSATSPPWRRRSQVHDWGGAPTSATRASEFSPRTELTGSERKKLVLVVIDGLTPEALDRGLDEGRLPALGALADAGWTGRGTSVFPSVTPVCLTSIATGAFPDVHHIPHLVWYHRGEQRVVEYGSSFPAMRAVGARQALRDTVFGMSGEHVSPRATTVFEALEDAGLEPARSTSRATADGPATRSACRRSLGGTVGTRPCTGRPSLLLLQRLRVRPDRLAARGPLPAGRVDRRLRRRRRAMARDPRCLRLPRLLPPGLRLRVAPLGPRRRRSRPSSARTRALGRLLGAAGGPEAFLERYAVLVCSDHGQTQVERLARLQDSFPESLEGVLALASNRAGMIYRLPGCRLDAPALAERLDDEPAADVVLFRERRSRGRTEGRRGAPLRPRR